MPLVYLDNCALQRPLDDRSQFRVRIEADAITAFLDAVLLGNVELASSAALRAESSLVRQVSRRDFIERVLALAAKVAPPITASQTWVQEYQNAGIKPFDALHLASAVAVGADYLCTTDDTFLRRAQGVNTEGTSVVGAIELATLLKL